MNMCIRACAGMCASVMCASVMCTWYVSMYLCEMFGHLDIPKLTV